MRRTPVHDVEVDKRQEMWAVYNSAEFGASWGCVFARQRQFQSLSCSDRSNYRS